MSGILTEEEEREFDALERAWENGRDSLWGGVNPLGMAPDGDSDPYSGYGPFQDEYHGSEQEYDDFMRDVGWED
jgi:hypothetical protein